MSENRGEYAALLTGRRWVIVVVTLASVSTFTLTLPLAQGTVPLLQIAMVAVMWVLAVVGALLSSRSTGLWILAAATVVLSLVGVTGDQLWTQFMPVVAVYEVALIVIGLSSRVVGSIALGLGSVFLVVIPSGQAVVVELGEWGITAGAVRALQLVLAGGFLVYAWPGIVDQARRSDAQQESRQRAINGSLRTQERMRVWRDTAIRVHETVLNDIRYVLSASDIDGERLRLALDTRLEGGRLQVVPGQSLQQVVESAVVESGFSSVVSMDVPQVLMRPDVAPYARAALIEVLRNFERHVPGGDVSISGSRVDEFTRVACEVDVGWTRGSDADPPGIGRAIVIGEALSSIGGRVDLQESSVTLCLPRSAAGASSEYDVRADPGRIAAGGVLAGVAVGAFPYPLSLVMTGSPLLAAAGVVALAILATSVVTTLRRTRLSAVATVLLGLVGLAVPVLMWGERGICVDATSLANVVDITGFALVAIVVWSRLWGAVVALLPWAVGATAFVAVSPPVACEPIPLIALLASVLVGVLMAGVLQWSIPRARRLADRSRHLEEDRLQEAVRAEAALDMAQTLDASVAAAWDVMGEIARDGRVDATQRDALRLMEARIRATIQVDPRTSGAVAQLARTLVMQAVARGRSVQVLSIRDSQDRRPLPSELGEQFAEFMVSSGIEPSIQVLAHGGGDHLTITGAADTAAELGLRVGPPRVIDGVHLEVLDTGHAQGVVAVLLMRTAAS